MADDNKPNLPEKPERASEFLLYQTEDGQTRLEVRLVGETVWLSLKQMADLFHRDKSVVSRHIRNIFEEGELRPEAVVAEYATTAADGKTYRVEYFNLDVVISVGYRVSSHRGTQFRIWATQRLREHIVKGFTLDDDRFKRLGGDDTLRNCSGASGTSGTPRKSSGARCSRSTPRASTTIRTSISRASFSPPCRTRCTGPHTVTPQPRSSRAVRMPPVPTWG